MQQLAEWNKKGHYDEIIPPSLILDNDPHDTLVEFCNYHTSQGHELDFDPEVAQKRKGNRYQGMLAVSAQVQHGRLLPDAIAGNIETPDNDDQSLHPAEFIHQKVLEGERISLKPLSRHAYINTTFVPVFQLIGSDRAVVGVKDKGNSATLEGDLRQMFSKAQQWYVEQDNAEFDTRQDWFKKNTSGKIHTFQDVWMTQKLVANRKTKIPDRQPVDFGVFKIRELFSHDWYDLAVDGNGIISYYAAKALRAIQYATFYIGESAPKTSVSGIEFAKSLIDMGVARPKKVGGAIHVGKEQFGIHSQNELVVQGKVDKKGRVENWVLKITNEKADLMKNGRLHRTLRLPNDGKNYNNQVCMWVALLFSKDGEYAGLSV